MRTIMMLQCIENQSIGVAASVLCWVVFVYPLRVSNASIQTLGSTGSYRHHHHHHHYMHNYPN